MTRVPVAIAWPAAIRRHARPSGSTGACAIYGRAARPAHIAGLPRQNPAAMGAIESWDGVACADAAAAQPSGAVEYCDAMAYAKYCCALPLLRISRSPWWWCSALPWYSGGPARVRQRYRGVSGKSGLPSGFDNARAGQCRTRGVVFLPTASLVLYTLSGSRFCCRRGCHSWRWMACVASCTLRAVLRASLCGPSLFSAGQVRPHRPRCMLHLSMRCSAT